MASALGTLTLSFYGVPGATPAYSVFPIPLTNDDGSAPTMVADNAAAVSLSVGGSDPNWMGTITCLGVATTANVTFSADNAPDQTLVVVCEQIPPEATNVTLAAIQAGVVPAALPANEPSVAPAPHS